MQLLKSYYLKHNFPALNPVLVFLILCFVLFTLWSCAATVPPNRPQVNIPLLKKWHGDYPVSQLARLPAGQQDLAVGYINDTETFIPIWRTFMPKEILPAVDFNKNFIVFTRNITFYNQKAILTVRLESGTAEIIAMETLSSIPIEDRVAMAMALIPREGIRAVKSGDAIIEVVSQ